MTGDVTPAGMLADYRANTDQFMADQAQLFRGLSAADQRELLFFMTMHASMQVMELQRLLMAATRPPTINGGQPQ